MGVRFIQILFCIMITQTMVQQNTSTEIQQETLESPMSFGLAPGSYTQHQHSDHLPQEPAYVPFTLSSLSAPASAILGPTDPSN